MGDLVLAVDTAGARCSACVYDAGGGGVLSRAEPEIGRGHAELLMDLLGGLLSQAGAAYGDLAKLAVVVGPGSFTGLRVGVAAVRGLSLALDLPAVGVGALEALAEPHRGAAVLAVLDAKRGEVYAALHAAGGAELRAPAALAPSDLLGFAAGLGGGSDLVLAGSGAALAETVLGDRFRLALAGSREADIAAVARIGAGRAPGSAPRPLYLRGADAKPQAKGPLARTGAGGAVRASYQRP